VAARDDDLGQGSRSVGGRRRLVCRRRLGSHHGRCRSNVRGRRHSNHRRNNLGSRRLGREDVLVRTERVDRKRSGGGGGATGSCRLPRPSKSRARGSSRNEPVGCGGAAVAATPGVAATASAGATAVAGIWSCGGAAASPVQPGGGPAVAGCPVCNGAGCPARGAAGCPARAAAIRRSSSPRWRSRTKMSSTTTTSAATPMPSHCKSIAAIISVLPLTHGPRTSSSALVGCSLRCLRGGGTIEP